MDKQFAIRKAAKQDSSEIVRLIEELAEYEKMRNDCQITVEKLEHDCFDQNRNIGCFVAETTGDKPEVIAYALYYYVYSTFRGRSLFLEDMYVTPLHRGNGVGAALYKAVAKEAVDAGCARLDFMVLDWNKKAVEFHKKHHAKDMTEEAGWHLYRIDQDDLKKLVT